MDTEILPSFSSLGRTFEIYPLFPQKEIHKLITNFKIISCFGICVVLNFFPRICLLEYVSFNNPEQNIDTWSLSHLLIC